MFIFNFISIVVTALLIVQSATGVEVSCKTILSDDISIVPSQFPEHQYVIIPSGNGRDNDVVHEYRTFVEKFSKPGGVLDQLGIPRTKQIVEFVRGVDMLALTATAAAQPVSHFLDGAQVVNSVNRGGLIYEVVFPGADYNHGYYRDDNPFEAQVSILMHVIGHNHFALTSVFPHYRASHSTQAATDLDAALREAYEFAPKEDVENFYLHMQTLSNMSDYYSAYYQPVSDFSLEELRGNQDSGGDTEVAIKQRNILERGLKASTENVLPAFVSRLEESNEPEWKKKIARLFPDLAPYRPALVHTQVMNEGWASIMQEIVMDHMGPEYNTVNHWIEAQHVTRSEPHLLISDPYWLGVRAWKRLRQKFEERPEILALTTQLAKDRAFIRYAEEEFISKQDDYQFLNVALDDHMIQSLEMAITRKATPEEAQNLPQPPQGMENPEPHIIVTKDPARVRASIIDQSVAKKVKYRPRTVLKSFNRKGTGEVELAIEDDFGRQIPIDKKSLGPALYSLSNILNQPVSLEAAFEQVTFSQPTMHDNYHWGPKKTTNLVRARVVVNSSGKVEVVIINENKDENPIGARTTSQRVVNGERSLLKEIEDGLFSYLTQLHLEDDARLEDIASENPRFEKLAMHSLTQMINDMPITSLIEHVPAAADAIGEYNSKVGGRMLKALELAARGNGGLVNTPKGLFLKALPGTHDINFDNSYLNNFINASTPGSVDQFMVTTALSNPFDGSDIGGTIRSPIGSAPGNGGWIPGPGSGQGQGQGDPQPGEPAEPGDDEAPGTSPGEVGLDPTWVPFPEDLYANFLGERVTLPNLKPKSGKTNSRRTRMSGRQNRRHGSMVVDQTALNALRKGIGAQIAGGDDPLESDVGALMELGFGLMRPQDFVVKKPKVITKPDTNAVVIFARDASGSTSPYTELYKRFVYDLKTLIKSNYKNVVFEYIIFDTEAYVIANEAEFFKAELGGGTSYKAGVDKVRGLMAEKYPEAKYDRFPFIIGDLGDYFNDETRDSYEAMIEEASFSGTVKGGWGVDDFKDNMEALAGDNEFYGFVDLGEDPKGYEIEHLRKLLKNEDEE